MKKALMILGGGFLVLVVLGVIGFAFLIVNGSKGDAAGKAYAESIIPPLFSDFTPANLLKYMSEADRQKIPAGSLEKFADKIRNEYGAYKSFSDVQGQEIVNFSPNGKLDIGKYSAIINFEKTRAHGYFILRKTGDQWSVMRIDVLEDVADPSVKSVP